MRSVMAAGSTTFAAWGGEWRQLGRQRPLPRSPETRCLPSTSPPEGAAKQDLLPSLYSLATNVTLPQRNQMSEELLTITMVAQLLHVSERTIYRRAAARELPGFKFGGSWRFRRSDIETWIESQVAESQHPNLRQKLRGTRARKR